MSTLASSFRGRYGVLLAVAVAVLLSPSDLSGQEEKTSDKRAPGLAQAEFAKKLEKVREAQALLEEARHRMNVEEAKELLESVRDPQKATSFDLCMANVPQEITELLATFPHLSSINLRCDSIDADAAPAFAKMKKLAGLHATGQVTDEFAAAISSLPHLQQLSLNPEQLSQQGCEDIAKAPWLSVIYVTGPVQGKPFFTCLGEKAKLVSLGLWKCKLDEEATKSLSSLKRLHSLTIDEHSEIEGDFVAAIKSAPSLGRLTIRQGKTVLSDSPLSSLARMPQLTELDLAFTFLTSSQLFDFGNAERLTSLKFRGEVPQTVIESFLRTQPKDCQAIQLTTESVELEGWKYTLKEGELVFKSWPEVIEKLRAN